MVFSDELECSIFECDEMMNMSMQTGSLALLHSTLLSVASTKDGKGCGVEQGG